MANNENVSLEEAVGKAASEQNIEVDNETETNEGQDEKTEKVDKEEEIKLDKRTTQALELLEALEDPKRARNVVEHLAKQAGLLKSEPLTRAEERKAERTIKEIVKEKLGENGAWLSESLGDAIEEVFREHSLQVDNKITDAENRREAEKFESDYKSAVSELKITEAEAVEISKLADEMPWSGKTPLSNYLSKMVKLVRSEATEKSRVTEIKRKQQENIKSQTKTLGVQSNEERIKSGSAKISVREAVLAAQRGELLE